ncbi:uncharacterized protein LOC129228254 [Uloborus diversus]|uniref:uncharacterized protein LOC129228254 n=1 Tax=Uloborus diversus TaxID=327109 RepID=UPI00240A0153|nr:uncharacterized protein LOC129228254 [Uloborus diversus]
MNWPVIQVLLVLTCGLCILAVDKNELSGVMPTDGEREVCERNAGEKEVEDVKKDRPRSCHVVCTYEDGSENTYNSPDGQLCCDMVGVGPTGTCKDGKCDLGKL